MRHSGFLIVHVLLAIKLVLHWAGLHGVHDRFNLSLLSSGLVEICDNAKDDDKDGLIDINDPDCICTVVKPESLIPNPSFEVKKCCPSNRSQLNCADGWIQASEPTTDYLHTCGWMGWTQFPPPRPIPDGSGFVGFRDGRVDNGSSPDRNWKEYAGACLIKPLEADKKYVFEFYLGFVNGTYSPPINVTFFGTADCKHLPFGVGNQALGCPTNGPNWVRLGSVFVDGNNENKWVKTSISVTPKENIAAIAIGPDCPVVLSPVSLYYFFDNLILADFESFEFKIAEVQHPCSDDFLLEVPYKTSLKYQWYKNGVALIGELNTKLTKMYGEGKYQVRTMDGLACKVTEVYEHNKKDIQNSKRITICYDEAYKFGDKILTEGGLYSHTFKTKNNCDSTVHLELKVLGELSDTVSAKIFEGERYRLGKKTFTESGDHLVHFESTVGCDSLVLLQLNYYAVYFPNIFTPNGDGHNDIFTIYTEEEEIAGCEIQVFDRWGEKIFTGATWDGSHKYGIPVSGVYVYIAEIHLKDGGLKRYSGSVTLMR